MRVNTSPRFLWSQNRIESLTKTFAKIRPTRGWELWLLKVFSFELAAKGESMVIQFEVIPRLHFRTTVKMSFWMRLWADSILDIVTLANQLFQIFQFIIWLPNVSCVRSSPVHHGTACYLMMNAAVTVKIFTFHSFTARPHQQHFNRCWIWKWIICNSILWWKQKAIRKPFDMSHWICMYIYVFRCWLYGLQLLLAKNLSSVIGLLGLLCTLQKG